MNRRLSSFTSISTVFQSGEDAWWKGNCEGLCALKYHLRSDRTLPQLDKNCSNHLVIEINSKEC